MSSQQQLEHKCYTEYVLFYYYKLTSEQFSFATGKYKTQLYDENVRDFLPSSPGIGMHVEVKDPNLKVILSKYYSSEGRFTFTSHSPGEHLICLHSNSTRWSLWAGGKLVSGDVAICVICAKTALVA